MPLNSMLRKVKFFILTTDNIKLNLSHILNLIIMYFYIMSQKLHNYIHELLLNGRSTGYLKKVICLWQYHVLFMLIKNFLKMIKVIPDRFSKVGFFWNPLVLFLQFTLEYQFDLSLNQVCFTNLQFHNPSNLQCIICQGRHCSWILMDW